MVLSRGKILILQMNRSIRNSIRWCRKSSAVIIRDDSEYDLWLMVYRPDTIQGYLNRCTSVEEVYNYFGQSDYVCIPSELSEEILENDEVNEDLKEWIESAGQTGDFVILNLQKE